MKEIKLEKIVVKNNRVDYFFMLSDKIQKYFKKDNHMFIEYNDDLSDVPKSILAIPFVSNVAPLAWITDSVVSVEELDQSFYKCLIKVRQGYQNMFPNVKFKGKVMAKTIIDNTYNPETEAAALFSGGLDAMTTFIRIRDKRPILITEYGWHEEDIVASEVWDADKENAINFAKKEGLNNILLQSNYGTFMVAENIDRDFRKKLNDSWWHGLHHGLAIISAPIPIAYKLKVKSIFIASSNSEQFSVPCASDPTVDNELRFGSGRVYHDGYELTRQDKIRVVTNHYGKINESIQLRVCFRNEDNCCNCEKCLRTILGIIAEGKNPYKYGFNIPSDFSLHVKAFFNKEIKFFTPTFISIYWILIQKRMEENQKKIIFNDLLDWFLTYNFKAERKKALLKYRATNFYPIVRRKINTRIRRVIDKVSEG
jgi:hypothetical protein